MKNIWGHRELFFVIIVSLIAFTEHGEVFTWGKGKAGRLGHGDTRDRQVLADHNIFGYAYIVPVSTFCL